MKNFIVILIGFVLVGCGTNSFTTNEGTVVSYYEKGNGDLPSDTLVCLFNIQYSTEDGQVMQEGDASNPVPLKIDSRKVEQFGDFYEILSKLRAGDSVNFEFEAEKLFSNVFGAPRPDSIAAESKIQFQVAFQEQITENAYFLRRAERQRKLEEEQLAKDKEILNAYLSDNGIETIETESGLRYIIHEQGTGPTPVLGQVVKVDYVGKLLTGEIFDTSNEELAKEQGLFNAQRPYEPYAFAMERGPVIKGWHIGVKLLNVGTKATLYIPSTLAYGNRGSGIITPNSILVFDVELVDMEEVEVVDNEEPVE